MWVVSQQLQFNIIGRLCGGRSAIINIRTDCLVQHVARAPVNPEAAARGITVTGHKTGFHRSGLWNMTTLVK